MKCPYCGQENSETYKFCRRCGQKRPPSPPPAPAAGQPTQPSIPPTIKAGLPPEQPSGAGSGAAQVPPTVRAAPDAYLPQMPEQAAPIYGAPPEATQRVTPEAYPIGTPGQVPIVPPTVRADLGSAASPIPGPAAPTFVGAQYPAAQPPYPPPGGIPAPMAAPTSQRLRRPGLVFAILVGFILLVILAAATTFILLKPGAFSAVALLKGKHLVIGLPQSGEGESIHSTLYLLEEEQEINDGTLLVETAGEADVIFYASRRNQPDYRLSKDSKNFAGFPPDTNHLFFWYLEGEAAPYEIILEHITPGDTSSDPIFNAQADILSGVVSDKGKTVLLSKSSPEGSRCYASQDSESARDLGEGDECIISQDGSTALILKAEAGKLSVEAVTVAEDEEISLLKDKEGASEVRLSRDGMLVAYVETSDNRAQVVLLDAQTGDELERSEEADQISSLEFAPRGEILYYITEDKNGEQQLFVLDQEGSENVATAKSFQAQLSQNGKYLVYLSIDEDGKPTLLSYKVSDDTKEEILSTENLSYTLLEYPERVLIKEVNGTEITLYSAPTSGEDPLELYRTDEYELVQIMRVPGENKLILSLRDPDALISLYVTSTDKDDGYFLINDYAEVKLLNQSLDGKKLVFWGQKNPGDKPGLTIIDFEENADPTLLDDNLQEVTNAIFSTNNKDIYYTAKTGANAGDVQVRRVAADGEGSPVEEYSNAFLADAQWSALEPFETFDWGEAIAASGTLLRSTSCLSADKLLIDLSAGSKVPGTLIGGEQNCYRFEPSDQKVYSIAIDSLAMMDPVLSVLTPDGTVLGEDDDSGPGSDPLLTISPTVTSTLTIAVWSKEQQGGERSGDYQIRLSEGTPELAFSNAALLPMAERLRGAITSTSALPTSTSILGSEAPTYGNMYGITGKAGQNIKINVFARSIGSQLTPQVRVFDSNQMPVKEDDIILTGNQDYSFLYTLNSDGRFYILVKDDLNRYGSEDKFFYEIVWDEPASDS